MKTKCQITFFIIFGFFLLLSVGLITYLGYSTTSTTQTTPPSVDFLPVDAFVRQCLIDSFESSLYLAGFQGGYISQPELFERIVFLDVPIYANFGVNKVPDLSMVESELALASKELFHSCLKNDGGITQQGFSIDVASDSQTQVVLARNYSTILYTGDITFEKDSSQRTVSFFNAGLNLPFLAYYNITQEFISYQVQKPEYFAIGYLTFLSEIHGFTYELFYLTENKVAVTLLSPKHANDLSVPFAYSFVLRYGDIPVEGETL